MKTPTQGLLIILNKFNFIQYCRSVTYIRSELFSTSSAKKFVGVPLRSVSHLVVFRGPAIALPPRGVLPWAFWIKTYVP